MTGMSLFTYEASRDIQVVMGAAFLNLHNQEFYPVAGVIWQSFDHLQFEIVFLSFLFTTFFSFLNFFFHFYNQFFN